MAEEKAYEPKQFIESVGKSHLVYPLDQTPDNFYPECISFTFQKRIGVGLKDAAEIIGAAFSERFGSNYENYANEIDAYEKKKATIMAGPEEGRNRLIIDRHMLFIKVPSSWPNDKSCNFIIESIDLTIRLSFEFNAFIDSIFNIHMTLYDVIPCG